ncbi:MAG: hypothetical protein II942_01140, partial [Alphaproteobacteria bacterium]|nr:hypothetical protein [Alphaproteobacteria bacterium]
WVNGNKCATCPANATCDGKTVKCQGKNFKLVGTQCVCPGAIACKPAKGGGTNYNDCHCYACPANGVCDGKGNWKCKVGYAASGTADTHGSGGYWAWEGKGRHPECRAVKDAGQESSVTNGKISNGCTKGYYGDSQNRKCLPCPSGADCPGGTPYYNARWTCKSGYGYDHSKGSTRCVKCPSGAQYCNFDMKTGALQSVGCAKGYHWPWVKKGGRDTKRCVKEGKCNLNNPC